MQQLHSHHTATTRQRDLRRRGDVAPQEDLTGDVVVAAIGNFIGSMGYLPHSTRLATLRPDDRQRVASHVEMVAKWAEDVLEALKHGDVYVIEEA